jgi:hypothetical protein
LTSKTANKSWSFCQSKADHSLRSSLRVTGPGKPPEALIETASATDLQTTSSAEYTVNKIKRNKLGAITSLVVLFGLLTLGIFFYSKYFAAGEKGIDSLAVLPFANDTGDPEMEYLSDGLSENLINNLSQLPSLKKVTGIIPSIC